MITPNSPEQFLAAMDCAVASLRSAISALPPRDRRDIESCVTHDRLLENLGSCLCFRDACLQQIRNVSQTDLIEIVERDFA